MALFLVFSVLLLGLGFLIWSYVIEPNWFCLRRVVLRVKKPLKQPLKILHLSDLHFTKQRFFLKRFLDRLAKLEVDFVFVTGDLIDSPWGIEPCVSHLRKLTPKRGIYVVLGNHDYENYRLRDLGMWFFRGRSQAEARPEVEHLIQALRRARIQVLRNENVSVVLEDGKDIILVGLDDPVTGRADLDQAFRGIVDGTLHFVLAHSPAVFPDLASRDVDAAFAGHSHGGQIRLPGIGPLPYVYRLSPVIDSTTRYGCPGLVSRGMGAYPFTRLRLLCRPEAILIKIEGQIDGSGRDKL